jgi:hypothetical protein
MSVEKILLQIAIIQLLESSRVIQRHTRAYAFQYLRRRQFPRSKCCPRFLMMVTLLDGFGL